MRILAACFDAILLASVQAAAERRRVAPRRGGGQAAAADGAAPGAPGVSAAARVMARARRPTAGGAVPGGQLPGAGPRHAPVRLPLPTGASTLNAAWSARRMSLGQDLGCNEVSKRRSQLLHFC